MALSYYRIKHSIPGRMRVKSFLMKKDPARCTIISDTLKEMRGIVAVTGNPVVGSALILYDEKMVTQDTVLAKLDELFPAPNDLKSETSIRDVENSAAPKPRSLLKDFLEVSGLAFIAVYFLIKSVFGKTPIKESIFSFPALASVFFGYPILKKAVQDIVEKKKYSLHQFMAFTAIVAILMTEALTALEIIFIMRLGSLIKDYITERSRRAIRNILSLNEKEAYQVIDGVEVATSVSELRVGAIVAVHTGERIPADGV
ncbi:MAG: hypothetical protein U9Q84_07210, partial [Thermodesulfobacteriota bacterium]|nr:hypothetical protein [Thermodesulfobacteriota bacterium]